VGSVGADEEGDGAEGDDGDEDADKSMHGWLSIKE
jgi:hypothetical protein